MKRLKKMTDAMFDRLPPLDVGDPETFITETVAIFLEFPDEVVAKVVREIPRRSDRPTLRLIKAVCDELFAPLEREAERPKAIPELPRPPRTPEQQARIDRQVAEARRRMAAATTLETHVSPPSDRLAPITPWRGDGNHAQRVAADLAARKPKNEGGETAP